MGIIVDVSIVLIIALTTFLGYRKGLVKVAFSIVSFILALILAFILFKPVSTLIINTTSIDDNLKQTIYENLASKDLSIENAEELKEQNIPQSVIDDITEYIQEAGEQTQDEVALFVSEQLTTTIINIGVALIVFILAKIILFFVKALADLIAKLPILKQLNKTGGVIYGVLKGLIIIYIVLAIITLITPVFNNQAILEAINSSFIGKFMYNNNILLNIFF